MPRVLGLVDKDSNSVMGGHVCSSHEVKRALPGELGLRRWSEANLGQDQGQDAEVEEVNQYEDGDC